MNRINKKLVILLTLGVIVLIGIIGGLIYLQSFKMAHIEIKKDVKVGITKRDGEKELVSLDKSGDVRLEKGDYTATITSDRYDTTPVDFTVANENITITIEPSYSASYLNTLLTREQDAITSVIQNAYASELSTFRVSRGTLYGEGEWYGTTLIQKSPNPSEQTDTYRLIMKKEQGAWQIKTTPALSLRAAEYPDIPYTIVSKVNEMPWEPAR